MTTIYLVEHTINSEEDYAIFPLKAFRDQKAALKFIDDCYTESIRIVEELIKYWDKHIDEFQELNNNLMKTIRKSKRTKKVDKNSETINRIMKIRNGEQKIIMSHKYHPGAITNRNDESIYDMTEIELIE